MNSFKRANNHLTHVQIVSEYEDKARALERENGRLNAYKHKVENARYTLNTRIFSLRKSLERNPDKIKQAELELCLEIREELK